MFEASMMALVYIYTVFLACLSFPNVATETFLKRLSNDVQLDLINDTLIIRKCGHGKIGMKIGNDIECVPCHACTHGHEPSLQCGTIIKVNHGLEVGCKRCQKGFYSDTFSTEKCLPCTKCVDSERIVRRCTRKANTKCASCGKRFYFNKEKMACLPCWRCCGNPMDVVIDECKAQGTSYRCSFESSKHCDYKVSNQTKGFQNARNVNITFFNETNIRDSNKTRDTDSPGTFESSFLKWLSILVPVLMFLLLFFVCLYLSRKKSKTEKTINTIISFPKPIKKHSKCKTSCFIPFKDKHIPEILQENSSHQSDDLDDFCTYNEQYNMYLFKCGPFIRHDKDSISDRHKNLLVEVQDAPEDTNAVCHGLVISPIFKFYSQGTEFDMPVEIYLPHSASVRPHVKTWSFHLLSRDEREKDSEWVKFDGDVVVEENYVKFNTKTLLSYVVVGRPMEGAQKRMYLVLYSMQKMVSDRLEMTMYLVDDSKSSLNRIKKENKAKEWEILGSMHAVSVDCCRDFDITINIDKLIEPWSLVPQQLKVIKSSDVRKSFFSIPSFHAIFRRADLRANTFRCNFCVNIDGSEFVVPAVTFVPEEPLCVFVDVYSEEPPLYKKQALVAELPYDTKYQMCRQLDIPARDRGQWRDIARHLGLTDDEIQICCKEYATIEGSPSRAVIEMVCARNPRLTVGELSACFVKLQRRDVAAVLNQVKL